jgi:hypothetical protein
MKIYITFLTFLGASHCVAYSFVKTSRSSLYVPKPRFPASQLHVKRSRSSVRMFGEDLTKVDKIVDTTTIGTSKVPVVGIGTISWSSDSCKLSKNEMQRRTNECQLINLPFPL